MKHCAERKWERIKQGIVSTLHLPSLNDMNSALGIQVEHILISKQCSFLFSPKCCLGALWHEAHL